MVQAAGVLRRNGPRLLGRRRQVGPTLGPGGGGASLVRARSSGAALGAARNGGCRILRHGHFPRCSSEPPGRLLGGPFFSGARRRPRSPLAHSSSGRGSRAHLGSQQRHGPSRRPPLVALSLRGPSGSGVCGDWVQAAGVLRRNGPRLLGRRRRMGPTLGPGGAGPPSSGQFFLHDNFSTTPFFKRSGLCVLDIRLSISFR